VSYIGWPPGQLIARLRGAGPTSRKLLAGHAADVAQAQRPDIDNAITVFADEVGGSLPEPWSRTVRAAARSRANEAQAALGAAVSRGLPPRDKVTGWWRLVALVQWLLVLLSLAGLAWIVLILSLHGSHKSSSLVSDTSLVPWLAVMVVALLLLGWLIESWCQNMVVLAADREREQANQAIMSWLPPAASSPTTSVSAPRWPPPAPSDCRTDPARPLAFFLPNGPWFTPPVPSLPRAGMRPPSSHGSHRLQGAEDD
jgi:hypothetical protein